MKQISPFFGEILALLLVGMSGIIFPLHAQFSSFRSFNQEDGLPQPYVYALAQDTSGYLWIGTGDGLSRFDGLSFRTYTTADGLAENFITAMEVGSNGQLWLGHYQGGISLQSNPADTFQVVHASEAVNSRINQISLDDAGNAWFLPQNRGLIKAVPGGETTFYPFSGGTAFFSFSLLGNDRFLVGTQQGLWVLALENGELVAEKQFAELETAVHAVKALPGSDQFLVGTQNKGVWLYAKNKPLRQILTPEEVPGDIFAIEAGQGQVWLGTRMGGIFLVECTPQTEIFQVSRHFTQEHGLAHPYVLSLFTDRERNLWLGSNGGGLYQFKGRKFSQIPLMLDANITVLAQQSAGKWLLGTREKGLFEVNINKQLQPIATKKVEGLPTEEAITALLYDPKSGTCWLGVEGRGLYVWPKNGTPKLFKQLNPSFPAQHINKIVLGQNRTVWAGSRLHGLFAIDPATNQYDQYNTLNGLTHNNISDLHEDRQQRLWVVTSGGLCYVKEGVINYVENLPGVPNLTFNCATEDRQGHIWFGTDGNGVFVYDGLVFRNFQVQHGLLSNYIHSAIAGEKGVWFISRNGLSFYQTADGSFKTYGPSSSMGELEINPQAHWLSLDKQIWFGTNKGLLVYNPAYDIKNTIPPKVYITRFFVFDQQAEMEEGKKLPFREYRIRFDFKALALTAPEKTQYQYKLLGYDPEWSVLSSDTSVRFPHVDDGSYTFIVRAKNEDGTWSQTPSQFTFVVGKPIWKKWWFYLLLVAVVTLSFYFYYRMKMRNLMNINTMLEEKVTERTQELEKANLKLERQKTEIENAYHKLVDLEAFKDSMTNMIVHDLKNPLNSVIALSDQNPSVRQAGQQMLNMVMNILDVHKLEEANLRLNIEKYPLNLVIDDALNQVALLLHEKGLTLFKNLDTSLIAKIDYELMVRVVVNLLTNAIKYTPAGGKIEMRTRYEEEMGKEFAVVSVIDNGPGIAPVYQKAIFDKYKQLEQKHSGITASTGLGLTFCKLAIEAHGGSIDVKSEVGKGSHFFFKLNCLGRMETTVDDPENGQIFQETIGHVPINLSEKDKRHMQTALAGIKKLDIYDTSENISLIAQIPDKNEEIKKWKKEMEMAVFAFNQGRYKQLIEIAVEGNAQ